MQAALAPAQRALQIATTQDDFAMRMSSQFRLACVYHWLGQFREGIALHENTMQSLTGDLVYERYGAPGLRSITSLGVLEMSLGEVGEFKAGHTWLDDGLRIAASTQDPFGEIFLLRGGGFLHLQQGNLSQAIELLERAVTLHQESRTLVFATQTQIYLGQSYALAGRIEESLAQLDTVSNQVINLQDDLAIFLRTWLSEGYLYAGYPDRSIKLASTVLEIVPRKGHGPLLAHLFRVLGDLTLQGYPLGDEPAETHYQKALSLADELGMRPLQAHCHRGLGTLYRQTRQAEQARTELTIAIDMYRDMEMTFWIPETEAALASVEGR